MAFRYIDLFAGIGGLRQGFDAVGGECVFSCEIDKFARETYLANYDDGPNHVWAHDIREVDAAAVPEHDVLLAGFPCQPFSVVGITSLRTLGRPTGFMDKTRGTLFFDIARILDCHRPAAVVLENVKHILRHDNGKTFRVIRQTLEGIGYHITWRLINAKGWVPQHRERVFIVGFRDLDSADLANLDVPDPDKGPRLISVLHTENGSETPESPYTDEHGLVDDRYTLSDKDWVWRQSRKKEQRQRGNKFGFTIVGPNDTTRAIISGNYRNGSEILVRREEGNPRFLTPRECARLMGFQDSFAIPVTDSRAHRQFGNSVVVPVAKLIATFVVAHLRGDATTPIGAQQRMPL